MDNSKSVPDFILKKRSLKHDEIDLGELLIFNIDNLTNNEFNMLIQNFFKKDDEDHEYVPIIKTPSYLDKSYFCKFVFGYKQYTAHFLGEKRVTTKPTKEINKLKKIIIKFFNFLKKIMVQSLIYCPHCFNYVEDDNIIHLIGDIIKNSKVIERVYFPSFYLKDNVFKILREYMIGHTSLKCLDFEPKLCQTVPTICAEYINDIIKTSNIENMSGIPKNNIHTPYFFESLLDNFFRGRSINLNLHDEFINDEFSLKLSDMIKKKEINYLKKIDLSFNKITSKGFSILVDSLLESKNENITKIYMYNNKLDDDCIESLGKLIKKNKNITHIDLGYNDITDKGIEKLSEYIIGNISIKSIDLCNNYKITDVSSEVIKYMIKSSFISSIDLSYKKFNKKNVDEIKELLKIPIEEREIPLITFQDVKSASKRMKE